MLDVHLIPVLSHSATQLPPTRTLHDAIDALQRKFLAIVIATPRLPEEDDGAFLRRRSNIAATVQRKRLSWSERLLLKCHAWDAHCRREHVVTPASRFIKAKHCSVLR